MIFPAGDTCGKFFLIPLQILFMFGIINGTEKGVLTMLKLVLIDGNSLLNRAFYATKLLTTKDGTPTNAVFGFIKLLLKINGDIRPDRLIVAFDLKAPTFRHKMYDQYKGTRKPMPDDLAVQIPILKSLLSSMRIAMCEKEGYEADDIIGTLSRKFENTHSIIITGDRDSYQLVNENTDVYITKTGVSDVTKLTFANFKEQIGYEPRQVVDIKALMGDSSDNIPGVAGVGEKTALSLISSYDNLDNLYAHVEEIGGSVQAKLENGKESAYLSQKLAQIDVNAEIDVCLDKCAVLLPFSQEVRTQFLQLEFTSLLKLDIFAEDTSSLEPVMRAVAQVKQLSNTEELIDRFSREGNACVVCLNGKFYFSFGDGEEFCLKERETLLDEGVDSASIDEVLRFAFSKSARHMIVYGKKNLRHILGQRGISFDCEADDVSLMKYLTDYSGKDDNLTFVLESKGFDLSAPAGGVLALYEVLSEKLKEENLLSLYKDIELPLSDVLYDMEREGVKVDTEMFSVFESKYRAEIDVISKKIFTAAGEEFNLNSPAQLGKILFEKLKLPAPKKSKKGTYSTSADILEKLEPDYEIVRDVLRCRHLQKLLSTYIEGFRPLIGSKDKLVHTSFNQILTTTGRLSSANPNLQNIPVRDEEGRELRKLFIARADDRILLDADYSQIELRLLAHFSGCKELIDAYNNGEDIHALTASQVFGVPLGQVDAQMRRAAKAVNFGIIYGISDFGLANNLNIAPKQAREYIKAYFDRYSDVKKYMDSNVAFARQHGYVTTLLGRKRVIDEIRSSNFNIRAFGERAAMNMPLQGSSADIIKIAMVNISRRLKKEALRSKLILQVHDELVIDAYIDEQDKVTDILRYEMENAVKLKVPLTAEVHSGKNWYEAK